MSTNVSWLNPETTLDPLSEVNTTSTDVLPCPPWQQPQHVLFQLANICFVISYLAPNTKYGMFFMHSLLLFGFFLYSMWAWNIICAPVVFSWNFFFVLLNLGQILFMLYAMRKVKFPAELEDIYNSLFQPLQVSRLSFKKLASPDFSQLMSLHPGEAYAMQGLTKADRLGLLINGKVNVISGHNFLHHIEPKEFLDSPEFESSRSGVEEKFKVSIIATTPCRCLVWQRQTLEFLLIKENHLSNVLSLLLSRDIARKLYAMNDKIVTEKGSHLDIRLPSFTGSVSMQTPEDSRKRGTLIHQEFDKDGEESVFDSK